MRRIREQAGRIRDPKVLTILVLLAILVLVLIFDPFGKKIEFHIEDKCGKFVNLFSHTIEDEEQCLSRCRSQCESQDYSFNDIEFIKNDIGCNTCNCFCKG